MDLMNLKKELEEEIGRLRTAEDIAKGEWNERKEQLQQEPSRYMEIVLKYQHEYWRGRYEQARQARESVQNLYNKLY
jgi:hypothetical protein